MIEAGRGALSPMVGAAAAVAAAGLLGFVVIERRVASPMLPLELFHHPGFSGGNAIGVLINLGFYGQLFVINLFFQQVRHYSALTTGLAMLPQLGVVAIGSALSGRFTARTGGPLATLLIGLGVGAAGLLGLAPAAAVPGYLALVPPLVATGFGMSFTMPAATTAVVEGAPEERAGLAAGAVNAARQVGSVLGIALLGAAGLRVAFGVAGAAFLLAIVLSLVVVRRAPVRDSA